MKAPGETAGMHLLKYPSMEPVDLYKLVFQGAMGSGHAVSSSSAAEEWLKREMRNLGTLAGEELIEEVPSSSGIVRVNLRPYLRTGTPIDVLLRAFVRTGREFRGRTGEIEELWKAAEGGGLIDEMRRRAFPQVHHSAAYRRLYKPAYRVVQLKILKEEGFKA